MPTFDNSHLPVLIVEDDARLQEALAEVLIQAGYEVHTASDAAAATDLVRRHCYAAAVLDMRLPDNTDGSVLTVMTELDGNLPVIVVTGYETAYSRFSSLRDGAFGHLTKPYKSEEILALVGRAVTLRQLGEQAERAAQALDASNERFRSVVQSASDAIVLADRTGAILSWNMAAQQLFGYRTDEVVGRPLSMLMPARYRDAHQRGLERAALRRQQPAAGRRMDLHGLRKDGSEFPLELSLGTWAAKGELFYSGIIRDTTERQEADRALRASEERFRQVAENIREVFWMTTPDKNEVLYISPGYEKVWGRPCASLYAKPHSWLEAVHPDDRARVQHAALTRQIDGEYDEEYRILQPDGTVRWVHDRAFPVRDETGRVYRIAGLAADISERQAAHEALREAYEKIETIMTCLPAGIVIVNKDSQVVYANSIAYEHLRLHPPLIGEMLEDVLQGPWSGISVELPDTTEDQAHWQREGDVESNGRVYRYRVFPVIIKGGGQHQMGIVTWDITEQKQLQDQLIQAEKLTSVGTLVFGVAHEINNPMQGILGMSEVLLEEENPATIKEYVRDIIAYSHHIAAVVKELAAYARPASKDGEGAVDVSERLAEALKMVRRNPEAGNVQVVTEFQAVRPIRARRSEIDQIFVNLVSNAVQAMRGSGRLSVATGEDGGVVQVRVSDTGCGIPKALLNKIFDPFFTTKDPGKGTGLGLSIVQKLVQKYGGVIRVESEEGKGASFVLRFPVSEAKSAPPEEVPACQQVRAAS